MHQVLHFLDDPQAALAEAERITAPGGQILIADFLPHDLEFLRDEHAHRRLGFADADMEKWLSRLGLTSGSSRHLPAADNDLTVALWTAQKPISGQNNGARKGQSKARERN
jgi:SAM-dependent methyltransferase